MLQFRTLCVVCLLWSGLVNAEVMDSVQSGAQTFLQRCSLCHGSKGLGEGVLPLLLEDYPNTNLRHQSSKRDYLNILNTVRKGGAEGQQSTHSPPWKHELSETEANDVAAFVVLLQTDLNAATRRLNRVRQNSERVYGSKLFQVRCTRCHGPEGKGNGKMSRLIKSPPPADLSASVLNTSDLLAIISGGGQALNRSGQMPPWGQELSAAELKSVANYVLTLRDSRISALSPNNDTDTNEQQHHCAHSSSKCSNVKPD